MHKKAKLWNKTFGNIIMLLFQPCFSLHCIIATFPHSDLEECHQMYKSMGWDFWVNPGNILESSYPHSLLFYGAIPSHLPVTSSPQRPTEQLCREAGTISGTEGAAIYTHTYLLKESSLPFFVRTFIAILHYPLFSAAISSILEHAPPFVLKLHEVCRSRGNTSCKLV
jgi:hypothetical protein